MKPLAIDIFCGLGGWTEGLLAAGYYAVGFDIERHQYGDAKYPAQLVLQDSLTIHGKQFKDAALIVASPPCQEFSYMAMPWSRAKLIAAALRGQGEFPEGYTGSRTVAELTALFDACFRIQREACEAAGRHIPMVVENIRGAIPWVGRSRWNYGSFHLWGDVPALMPMTKRLPFKGGDRNIGRATGGHQWNTEFKVPGFRFDGTGKSFQSASVEGTKNTGGSWFNIAHNTTSGCGQNPDGRKTVGHANARDGFDHTRHLTNQAESDGVKQGGSWFYDSNGTLRSHHSSSNARKAASAAIAKIPYALAHYIATTFRPTA